MRDEVADQASKLLEKQLEKQQAEENAIIKLLVLGTGESGKSTVFKQMKILYSLPDPPAKFIMICRANLFGNAHAVMDGMEKLGITFKTGKGALAGAMLKAAPADGQPSGDAPLSSYAPAFKDMYLDPGTAEAIERAAEYQLNDSTIYFWERADELLKHDYTPTEQDVLRARVRTTGIVQQNFQIGEKKYTMFDVGGQRNERRKWIHCFDNVTAVIFVTAISEYDQLLYEDENTNRIDEALVLFDQICNHPSFKKTSMILFLNKRDLFEKKLKKKDLTCWENTPETKACGRDTTSASSTSRAASSRRTRTPWCARCTFTRPARLIRPISPSSWSPSSTSSSKTTCASSPRQTLAS
jgi:GTPase SAR1 family protein